MSNTSSTSNNSSTDLTGSVTESFTTTPQDYDSFPTADTTKKHHNNITKETFDKKRYYCDSYARTKEVQNYLHNLAVFGVSIDTDTYFRSHNIAKCFREKGYNVETEDYVTGNGTHSWIETKTTIRLPEN